MLESKTTWEFAEDIEINDSYQVRGKQLSHITTQLLLQREMTSEEQMEAFIYPKIEDLTHASLLSMMDQGVERVHDAIANGEHILIYGDYDADGVTSTALLVKALQDVGAQCSYYIPNRFSEGYGPNKVAFQQAIDDGVQLIITVDCGINAVEETALAQEQGVDVIITDHHDVQDELPKAYAIIHPELSEGYVFKGLAGVGVAFQFATEILQEFPIELLDFVAIGTIADLVPLQEDNRILTYHGLKQLQRTQHIGLQKLMQVCQFNSQVNEEDVGFSLAPRMNAVGRLQDASLAVELLLTMDPTEAEQIATEIEHLNNERKSIVQSILQEAVQLIPDEEHDVLFVAKEGWNEGVLGIVASHLVRMYDRPAIVLSVHADKGTMKGSARSIPAFHMFNHCMEIKDLFQAFGGHSQAAGMTIPLENADAVKEALNTSFRDTVAPEEMKFVTKVQATLAIEDINENVIEEISMLAPFGMGNPKPLFQVKSIPSDIRQLGAEKNHLKMQMTENGASIDLIAFQMGELYWKIASHTPVSIVGELGMNEWNGNRKVQLRVEDIQINNWQLFDYRGKQNNLLKQTFDPQRSEVFLYRSLEGKSKTLKHAQEITYANVTGIGGHCDALYIMDLPPDENHIEHIIYQLQPKVIYMCTHIENSSYFSTYTSRDDFKWVYGLLMKNSPINLKKIAKAIMDKKKWSQERMKFIFNVFLELEFVMINNGMISVQKQPESKDLTESVTFSQRIQKEKMERIFYYSNYTELRSRFSSYLERDTHVEGEVTNEFERTC